MAQYRKGCTRIERIFGEKTIGEQQLRKGITWNKVGMQYGELIVEETLSNGNYLCACSCGNYIVCSTDDLRLKLGKCKTHCGCLSRKYNKDIHYFDKIDTEEKAYILGFLATDGCIAVTKNGNKRIKITLKSSDKDILEKIKNQLKSDSPITTKKVHTKLPMGNYFDEETLLQLGHAYQQATSWHTLVPQKGE